MNKLPVDISNNESLWLQLLVDDQLSDSQRLTLFQYLDSDTDRWKRCAVAFVDDQLFAKQLGLASTELESSNGMASTEKPTKPKMQPTTNQSTWFMALAASLAFVLGAGSFYLFGLAFQSATPTTVQQQHDRDPLPRFSPAGFLTGNGPNSLIEIENSPTHAIYYTDHEVPEFLLDAMIRAGHRITFGQETVSVITATGDYVDVPVSTLEVAKYARKTL